MYMCVYDYVNILYMPYMYVYVHVLYMYMYMYITSHCLPTC